MAQSARKSNPAEPVDYILEDQVGHLLRRAHQRATAIFQEIMNQDLTPPQFAALVKIGDFGTVSQNRLGRAVAMDPATSQGVTQRLLTKNLIRREPDPKDRRCTLLSRTAEGEALVHKLLSVGLRITETTLEPLTAEERKTFLLLLKKLT